MKSYMFNIATGYLTLVNANKRHIKYETTIDETDGSPFPTRTGIPLNEIRSSDLEFDNTQTLQIVDDKIVVVPRPTKVLTPAEQIKDLWASLTDDEKAAVYTYAPNAILAWERDEMGVMIKLILANTEPAIATLKESVKAILGI